jgi:hypothetical protein
MVSKKQLIIEQIQAKSTATDEKSLKRMSIYDLNTLLGTLNGTPQPEVKTIDESVIPKPKLNRKVRKKARKIEEDDSEPQPQPQPSVSLDVSEIENEIVDEPTENDYIEEDIKPKKRGRPKKSETISKSKNVSFMDNVEVLEQPTRISKAMSKDKSEVKEILNDFKKEISKLLLQYRRVKNKTEQHKNILVDTYNDIYDTTVDLIEEQISMNYFPDDSIFEYSEKMMMNERKRIERVLA